MRVVLSVILFHFVTIVEQFTSDSQDQTEAKLYLTMKNYWMTFHLKYFLLFVYSKRKVFILFFFKEQKIKKNKDKGRKNRNWETCIWQRDGKELFRLSLCSAIVRLSCFYPLDFAVFIYYFINIKKETNIIACEEEGTTISDV